MLTIFLWKIHSCYHSIKISIKIDFFRWILYFTKLFKKSLTPTWFEHAAFWSGVRRATVAPRSQVKVPPRFELGSLDSKSRVLTITPWNPKVSVSTSIFDQHMSEMWDDCSVRRKENECFLPGSNRRPCACEAHVITTTLRKLWCSSYKMPSTDC